MKQPIQVKVPVENVNDITAKLVSCKVGSGSFVSEGSVIAELETTKTTFDVIAPGSGYIEFLWRVDDEVPVGEDLCRIHSEMRQSRGSDATATFLSSEDDVAQLESTAVEHESNSIPASISQGTEIESMDQSLNSIDRPPEVCLPIFSNGALKLIQELNVNPKEFLGSSFVREEDIRQYLGLTSQSKGSSKITQKPALVSNSILEKHGPKPEQSGKIVKLERAKVFENRELLIADRAVLKSTLHYICPVGDLSSVCARQSPPIGRLPLILFETAKLLSKYRALNSAFYEDSAYLYDQVNIGFAVDISNGLKVLVIRNAESLELNKLTERYEELLVRYTTNTLQVEDVTGSTFTVTDLSQEGVYSFDPIINKNQAAILGIGSDFAIGKNGCGFILSCAFDHRLNGGRVVSRFLKDLSDRLAAHAKSLKFGLNNTHESECTRCLRSSSQLRELDAFLIQSIEPSGHICSLCFSGY